MLRTSKKIAKERLNNGQCMHCGIQTHSVEKKRFGKNKKTPLNIPNKVDHGCCLRDSCLKAGANVVVEPNSGSLGRISAQTAGAVGSTVCSVVGVAVGAPEMGQAIGGGISDIASSLGGGGTSNTADSSFSGGDPLAQYMQQAQQMANPAADPLAQYMQQLQIQSSGSTNDALQQLMEQSNRQSQQAHDQLQQLMNLANQQSQAANENLQQYMHQMEQDQTLAVLHDQVQRGTLDIDISCPNGHATQLCPATETRCCDLCGVETNAVVGCPPCDFDLCLQCMRDAKSQVAKETCCSGHLAYHFLVRQDGGFICNFCCDEKSKGDMVLYCALCDWGTCVEGVCAQVARSSFLKCPSGGHFATISCIPTMHTCDICGADQPADSEVYKCHLCDWSVCLEHKTG
jgi:hypothetical protein